MAVCSRYNHGGYGTLVQSLIGYYLASINLASYGAVGSVMALMLWIYLNNLVLLIGAEVSRAAATDEALPSIEAPVLPSA